VEIITNIIVEYLKHNKRLCVPKLGTFIVKQSNGSIIFSDLMRGDDGVLRSLLVAAGKHELEANGLIDRFVFEIHHAISIDGEMKIEEFGLFTADINNTISFTSYKRKQVFGGRIKPPVEIIQERIPPRAPRPKRNMAHTTSAVQPTQRRKTDEEGGIAVGKPDSYLRGLKYDNSKNKKREESGHGKRVHGGGRGWIALIIVVAIAAGATYALWPRKKSVERPTAHIETEVVEHDVVIVDTLLPTDTLDFVGADFSIATDSTTPVQTATTATIGQEESNNE
jgi:hypothetical protein